MIEVPEGGTERSRPLALVVEPQEWAGRAIGSLLAPEGYSVVHAREGAEAVDQAAKLNPDVVVSNVRLPDMAGVDVCRSIRAIPHIPHAMPIVVTAAEALPRARRLELFRAGAWEYFHLPTHAEELTAKLAIFLQAKRESDRFREMGLVDPETGLYNVHGLLRRVREAGTEAMRFHRPMACVVFAPDFIADEELVESGNGSRAISSVVSALRQRCRASDALARLGKTQFMVLAPSTNGTGARGMATRLIEGMEEELRAEAAEREGEGLRLRAGVYAVSDFAEVALDPVEVLARATIALRRSQADPSGERIRVYQGNGNGAGPSQEEQETGRDQDGEGDEAGGGDPDEGPAEDEDPPGGGRDEDRRGGGGPDG